MISLYFILNLNSFISLLYFFLYCHRISTILVFYYSNLTWNYGFCYCCCFISVTNEKEKIAYSCVFLFFIYLFIYIILLFRLHLIIISCLDFLFFIFVVVVVVVVVLNLFDHFQKNKMRIIFKNNLCKILLKSLNKSFYFFCVQLSKYIIYISTKSL
jgi:hypothetical protein